MGVGALVEPVEVLGRQECGLGPGGGLGEPRGRAHRALVAAHAFVSSLRSGSTTSRVPTTARIPRNSSNEYRAGRLQFGCSPTVPGTFCRRVSSHRSSRPTVIILASLEGMS